MTEKAKMKNPTTGMTQSTDAPQGELVDSAGSSNTFAATQANAANTANTGAAGPRFGIFTLMLLTVVFCVMGSAGFYLLRSVQKGTSPRAVFVMFTLAAPGVLVIVMSMSRILLRWLARR